ncbi:hypothetical protein J6590_058859 [Homalodisca vitripennis]|nr:hypothetical protein J6590_058859 [Homalodisca vitripennis]
MSLLICSIEVLLDKGSASVDAKMLIAKQKAFCVIEYGRSESTTVVQRAFRAKYGVQPPDRWCIKRKSSGRPRTSDENVARIQQAFVRSPGKSTQRASRELQLPQTIVWRVLRKDLTLGIWSYVRLKISKKCQQLTICPVSISQTRRLQNIMFGFPVAIPIKSNLYEEVISLISSGVQFILRQCQNSKAAL